MKKQDKVLKMIKDNPGITTRELASRLKSTVHQIYQVTYALRQKGIQLIVENGKYSVPGTSSNVPATSKPKGKGPDLEAEVRKIAHLGKTVAPEHVDEYLDMCGKAIFYRASAEALALSGRVVHLARKEMQS